MNPVFADLALARRLERTEAGVTPLSSTRRRGSIRTPARSGRPLAARRHVCGRGLADYADVRLIHEPLVDKDLDAIEHFFRSRGSAVFHEVCPLAGVDVYATLARRGYKPVELSTVLYQPIDMTTRIASNPELTVRQAKASEAKAYGSIAAQGWSEHPEVMPYIEGFAQLSLASATCFFAERVTANRSRLRRCSCTRHGAAGRDQHHPGGGDAQTPAQRPITNRRFERLRPGDDGRLARQRVPAARRRDSHVATPENGCSKRET
jgi:hypothetical protein